MQSSNQIVVESIEFSVMPSSLCGREDWVVQTVENTLVVGYLADTIDPDHPSDIDVFGQIYSSHRLSQTHSEMQDALALDGNWEPDLELMDRFQKRIRSAWIEAAITSEEFILWCDRNGRIPLLVGNYFTNKAARLWREAQQGNFSLDEFEFTSMVVKSVWRDLRNRRLIGDEFVVVLNLTQHGGLHYSVTGRGHVDQWDTSEGCAVWVPSDCVRPELEKRAKVYALGQIKNNGRVLKQGRFWFEIDGEMAPICSISYATWAEAFSALESYISEHRLTLPKSTSDRELSLARGKSRAAIEVAESELQVFNAYYSGNCYDAMISTFVRDGNGAWREKTNECFGTTYEFFEASQFLEEQVSDFVCSLTFNN